VAATKGLCFYQNASSHFGSSLIPASKCFTMFGFRFLASPLYFFSSSQARIVISSEQHIIGCLKNNNEGVVVAWES